MAVRVLNLHVSEDSRLSQQLGLNDHGSSVEDDQNVVTQEGQKSTRSQNISALAKSDSEPALSLLVEP